MRNVSRISLMLALAPTALLGGCLSYDKGVAGRGGADGSVVAAVDGIDQKDRDNAKVGFWLKCRSGAEIKGEGATGDLIRFAADASKVADADVCWLEVRMADADAAALDWEWFGVKKDKSTDVGLLYGSTEDSIGTDRALSLTVYKLYSPKTPKAFKALVKAKFDLAETDTAPAEDKTKASLVCAVGTETKSYPGSMKKDATDGTLADFTFENLDAREMKGVECTKLVVLVDNKEAFAGDLAAVAFPKPKKGDEYSFAQADGKPFLVKKSGNGDIDVDTQNGGACLNYDAAEAKCKDVRSVKLPRAGNYLVAKIKGKKGGADGDVVTYLVGAGQGFGLLAKSELVLADVKTTLSINEEAPFSLFEHTDSLQTSVLGATFNTDLVAATAFASEKVSFEELKDVTLLHIDAVWVHGFAEVTQAALDAKASARWFAVVKAVKDGQADKEFVVGGVDQYFGSASAPATPKYIDFAAFVADMKAGGSTRWALYALQGKAMAPAACAADQAYYVDALAQTTIGGATPVNGTDAKLDACKVVDFDLTLEGASATAVFYVWDWQKL